MSLQLPGQAKFASLSTLDDIQAIGPGAVTGLLPSPDAPRGLPPGVSIRPTDDTNELRRNVYDTVLSAASSLKPIAGPEHTLSLVDVHYAADDPEYDKSHEKRALLERGSLARRLRGTWQLTDNATQTVLSKKVATVANVPAILHDGTFINKGTRYAMGYQQRLRPGIYVRAKTSGGFESHVNVEQGHGRSHRYLLEPQTGVFSINIGHSKIPLYPLLDTLGAKREDIEAAWGPELTKRNMEKVDSKAISKLYERLVPTKLKADGDQGDPVAMRNKIREAFDDMIVDPEVVGYTLDRATDKVDADLILRATKQTLALAKGERDPDDRDHLAFASFHSAPDVFAERLTNDYGKIRRELFHKVARRGNVDNVPSSILDRQIDAAIFRSGLASSVEDVNPMEILSAITKVTRYGEGGLPSIDSTPDESRNVGVGQFGFIDPVVTPESLRVGVDGYLARNTFIGSDKKLYTKALDREGQEVVVSPGQILRSTFSIGRSDLPGRDLLIRNGKMVLSKPEEAEFRLPNAEDMFGHAAGVTPMKSAQFGQRSSMAARMGGQAMAVDDAEAPLVQTGVPGTEYDSYEARNGERMGAVRASQPGRVLAVKPDHIEVIYQGGEKKKISLDNNRPGARKSVYHQDALVQAGEEFAPGQLLAKSNYTDREGVQALGRNLRTGLMSLEDNWEDGLVVSQSAANKMRIQQAYKHNLETGDGKAVGKNAFLTRFGTLYSAEQLDSIDDQGVIKPGSIVRTGDPLILATREKNGVGTRVHRQGKSNWGDSSVTWHHNHDGIVTDVFQSNKGAQVVVRSSKPLEDGDKLSGRAGNKGVITVWPDEQMPHDDDGVPLEVVISPQSVPSRGNSSFPIELLLGKVAAKRGKAYRVNDFEDRDLWKFAVEQAKQHGVSETDTLTDPRTGRKIKGVLTGQLFTMALSHMSESKQSARGLGKYNSEGLPARGADDGAQAKRQSGQELFAHLSHGAYDFNREGTLLRGTRNDDYWAAFMSGQQTAAPQVPEQYNAFITRLQASGINPVRRGSKTQLMAMTDKDVDEKSGGRIVTVADTVNMHKDLSPIAGGLFDPRLFGEGDRFGAIELPEKMPNPVFEEPIRRMLGMTEKTFRNVLSGREEMKGFGSGPEAIGKRLQTMNIDQEIGVAREAIAGTRKVARDDAVRRLRYLKGLKRAGTEPGDLMISKVPVLPPRFRPISQLAGKGGVMVNDANFLYKELMHANEALSGLKGRVDDVGDERLAIYDAHKALIGLAESTSHELQQRQVKGLLKTVLGKSSPKQSAMQRKLLSGNVDTIGRGAIMVNSNLDMDSVGIPESMAFKIYEPYIVRNMVQRGIPRVQAMEYLKDQREPAREALLHEMQRRPVTLTRAPVLHKYGNVGLWPHLVKGNAIRTNPVITQPLGGDFDGDTVNISVPHSPSAVREVTERMMPSRMLTSVADFKSPMFIPAQDHLLGAYQASVASREEKPTRYFATLADAKEAFQRGEIDIDTPIKLGKR